MSEHDDITDSIIYDLRLTIADTVSSLDTAISCLKIACDWGFTEVEIDGELESVSDILDMLRTTREEAIENMEADDG